MTNATSTHSVKTRLRPVVNLVALVRNPMPTVPNALNAMPEKREQEQMVLVNFVQKASTVKNLKTMVRLLQTPPFALVAPRVGHPTKVVRNVNRAKLVLLVLL